MRSRAGAAVPCQFHRSDTAVNGWMEAFYLALHKDLHPLGGKTQIDNSQKNSQGIYPHGCEEYCRPYQRAHHNNHLFSASGAAGSLSAPSPSAKVTA